METYLITASIDGVDIDFEKKFKSDGKPDYYTIYDLCMEHGCPFFHVSLLGDQGEIIDRVVLENQVKKYQKDIDKIDLN